MTRDESSSSLKMRQNASLSDLENMRGIGRGSSSGSLARESGASRASSMLSYASTISAGGGGSRAKPPRAPSDSNLPGAPGRFLAWLPRNPTLEGTLEKLRSDGMFSTTMRVLGMGTRGWKMRHFVLYDNHLFWGRGFSRMYGYGTVLSAYASPEDGETCFVLELVTHPKFSLRRGGIDSLDYWQRLYGLCCSTHGYSRRLLRAGTVLDRDRWIQAATRGLPHVSTNSPVSPAEAMLITEEKSVFAVPQDGRRDSMEDGTPEGRDEEDNLDEDEDGPDPFAITPNTARRRTRKRQEARERSGLWTPRDASGAEAEAAAAWEHAAAVLATAEAAAAHEEVLENKKGKRTGSSLPHVSTNSPVSPAEAMLITEEKSVFAVPQDGRRDSMEDGTPEGRDEEDNLDEDEDGPDPFAITPNTARRRTRKRQEARERSGLWTPRDASGAEAEAAAAWEHAAAVLATAEAAAAHEEVLENKKGKRTGSKENDSLKSDDGFVSADGSFRGSVASEVGIIASGSLERKLAADLVVQKIAVAGKPLPEPRGSALRKTSSIAKKSAAAQESGLFNLTGITDIFGGGTGSVSGDTSVIGSRKVKFRDEKVVNTDGGDDPENPTDEPGTLESTVEYAPTPTKRNPNGVGRTSAKMAPFSGTLGESDKQAAVDDEVDIDVHPAAQRALRHAAGRWVIPPEELKIGRRVGSGSFGEVFTADWNGTEVALKQMHNKNITGESVEEFAGEIRMMQGMRHPNVVLFLGAVINGPILNIVCELMPYGSLHSLLHGASRNGVELSTNGRLREQMARDCARGMSYLHSRSPPVVHNDLKPANLLVDAHWTVKVCDFGMSRLKHSTIAGSHSPGGTPEWMAPEALRNDPTDERSDVYSFAIILWELMTLKYPWEELSSPVQIVVQVAFLHRRPKLPTWLPSNAVQLLQKCWHKDPCERPGFPEILQLLKVGMPEAWQDMQGPVSDSPRSLIAAKKEAEAREKLEKINGKPTHQRQSSLSFNDIVDKGKNQKDTDAINVLAKQPETDQVNGNYNGSMYRSPSPSVEVAPGGFVSLKGLKPIKTPAVSVKKRVNALGPSHMTESGSSSEDEGAPVGGGGYSVSPEVLAGTPKGQSPKGNGIYSMQHPSPVKVLNPQMTAAGALKVPGLSPIKIKPTVSSN